MKRYSLTDLMVYLGKQVKVTQNNGGVIYGTMVTSDEENVTLTTDKETALIAYEDIDDVEYTGILTDYQTHRRSGVVNGVFRFALSDVITGENITENPAELMRYKEFECGISCRLRLDEMREKIEAYDVKLIRAEHVLNAGVLLEEKYLYKFEDNVWRIAVLTQREEEFVLLSAAGDGLAEADVKQIKDITRLPEINNEITATVAKDGNLQEHRGIVCAVLEDAIYLLEKVGEETIAPLKVYYKDLFQIRYHGKVTYSRDKRMIIDGCHSFKNPYYFRDYQNIAEEINGALMIRVEKNRKVSYVAGVSEEGLIAKDITVDAELPTYVGIILVHERTETLKTVQGFVGNRYGRCAAIQESDKATYQGTHEYGHSDYGIYPAGIKLYEGTTKMPVQDKFDSNDFRKNEYFYIAECMLDDASEDERGQKSKYKRIVGIKKIMRYPFEEGDAAVEIIRDEEDNYVGIRHISMMEVLENMYRKKTVDVICKNTEESNVSQMYTGVYNYNTEEGISLTLDGTEELKTIPWNVISEVRLYGKVTFVKENEDQGVEGKIDGLYFYEEMLPKELLSIDTPVLYEIQVSTPTKKNAEAKLRCVNIELLEKRQRVYIISQENNKYGYIPEEEYNNGNKTDIRTIVSDCDCFIPTIEKYDYPAEFVWKRQGGKEVLTEINLRQGTVAKEVFTKPATAVTAQKVAIMAPSIPEDAMTGWIVKNENSDKAVCVIGVGAGDENVDYAPDHTLFYFCKWALKQENPNISESEISEKTEPIRKDIFAEGKQKYIVRYKTSTEVNKKGKKVKHIFFYGIQEAEEKSAVSSAGTSSAVVAGGIVGDITQSTDIPKFMVGENVFFIKDANGKEEERIYGSVSRVNGKDVYVTGSSIYEPDNTVEYKVDWNADRIYRFGLLTGLSRDYSTICINNATSVDYRNIDDATYGCVKTAKKKRLVAYWCDPTGVKEVNRASSNSENSMAGIKKQENYAEGYRAADGMQWRLGTVVRYISDEKVAIIETEGEKRQIKYYVTVDGSQLINSLISKNDLVGKEVYVKVVAYPYNENGRLELRYDAVDMYPRSVDLRIRYNDKENRRRWEARIHDTLWIEVSGEEEYLESKEGSIIPISFEPGEDDGSVLHAVVRKPDNNNAVNIPRIVEVRTPILDSALGVLLKRDEEEVSEEELEKKLREKLVKRVQELENPEGIKEDEESSVWDEYSYLMSLLAQGGDDAALYRYLLFLGDFYQGEELKEKYTEARKPEFDAEKGLKQLFALRECANVRGLVRHIVVMQKGVFDWFNIAFLSRNNKLIEDIADSMRESVDMEAIFNEGKLSGDEFFESIRAFYQEKMGDFISDIKDAENCADIKDCLETLLSSRGSKNLQYFCGEYEVKQLEKVKMWSNAVSKGCHEQADWRKHKRYAKEIEKLEAEQSSSFTRLLTESIFGQINSDEYVNVIEIIKVNLRKNMDDFLKESDVSCVIPGNRIMAGQEKLTLCVQNYSEKNPVLGRVEDLCCELHLYKIEGDGNASIERESLNKAEIENALDRTSFKIEVLGETKERGNYHVEELELKLPSDKYPAGTRLLLCIKMSYKVQGKEERKEKEQEIEIEIVERSYIEAETPYHEDGKPPKDLFYGRATEFEDIRKTILRKVENGKSAAWETVPGSTVYIYGQKQCGKSSLVSQFIGNISGESTMLVNNGQPVTDSLVIMLNKFRDELIKDMPGSLNNKEKDAERMEYYNKKIQFLIMEKIQKAIENMNSGNTSEEESVTAQSEVPVELSDAELEEAAFDIFGEGWDEEPEAADAEEATDAEGKEIDYLNDKIPLPSQLSETYFEKFIGAFKDKVKKTLVIIMDEFTDYCEELKKLTTLNRDSGLAFMSSFEAYGFVQIFIGHEGMFELFNSMGLLNKGFVKKTTIELTELAEPDAQNMIQEPMEKIFGYNPYKWVPGTSALDEVLRLSGCNPKILNELCNIIFAYLKKEVNAGNRKYLTCADIKNALDRSRKYKIRDNNEKLFEAFLQENRDTEEWTMVSDVRKCLKYIAKNPQMPVKKMESFSTTVTEWKNGESREIEIDLIDKLKRRGVIEKEDGYLRIKVGWFADYLRSE